MTAVPHALGRLSLSLRLPWRDNLVNPRPLFNPSYVPSRTFSDGDTPGRAAFRAIPYPNTRPDPSLFEDEDEQYTSLSLPSKPLRAASTAWGYPCDPLAHLVYDKNYREAESVRAELVSMGVSIVPRTGYFLAAQNVLDNELKNPHRYASFLNWLSLVRPATTNYSALLNVIKQRLFFNNAVPLNVAIEFGLLCARKGYAPLVGQTVVGHVARYADLDVIRRFLDDFYEAYTGFSTQMASHLGGSRHEKRSRWWSLAVRTQCLASQPRHAVALLIDAHWRGVSINQYTFQYVLTLLKNRGETELADEMEALGYSVDSGSPSSSNRSSAVLPISKDRPFKHNLAIALHILLSRKDVSITSLVPFFDIYKRVSTRQDLHILPTPEVNLLRAKAYRYSFHSLSLIIHAEMIHHHRRHEWKRVLDLFHKFFHSVSVPEDILLRHLYRRHNFPENRRIYRRPDGSLPPWVEESTFNLPQKLWADTYITSLVWNAIVQSARTSQEVHMLYRRFMEILQLQQSHPHEPVPSSLPSPSPISPPTSMADPLDSHASIPSFSPDTSSSSNFFDSAPAPEIAEQTVVAPILVPAEYFDNGHFLPFLRAFCHYRDFKMAFRVLDFMRSQGIEPNIAAYGTIAGKMALQGEPEKAMELVMEMERMHMERLGLPGDFLESRKDSSSGEVMRDWRERFGEGPWSTPEGRKKSVELLKAFTNVMSGFVSKGMRRSARAIRDRMEYPWGFPFEPSGPVASDIATPADAQANAEEPLGVGGHAGPMPTAGTAARKSTRLGDLQDQRQVELVRRIARQLDGRAATTGLTAEWTVIRPSSTIQQFGLKSKDAATPTGDGSVPS